MKKINILVLGIFLILTGCADSNLSEKNIEIQYDKMDSVFISNSKFEEIEKSGNLISSISSESDTVSYEETFISIIDSNELNQDNCFIKNISTNKTLFNCEDGMKDGEILAINDKFLCVVEYSDSQQQYGTFVVYDFENESKKVINSKSGDFLTWEPKALLLDDNLIFYTATKETYQIVNYNLSTGKSDVVLEDILLPRFYSKTNEIFYVYSDYYFDSINKENGIYEYNYETNKSELVYQGSNIRNYVFYDDVMYVFESFGNENNEIISTMINTETDEIVELSLGVIDSYAIENLVITKKNEQIVVIDLLTQTEYIFEKTPEESLIDYEIEIKNNNIYLKKIFYSNNKNKIKSVDTYLISKDELENLLQEN